MIPTSPATTATTSSKETIIIIGYGAMAKAIARGLNGLYHLEICGRDATKSQHFITSLNLIDAIALPLQPTAIHPHTSSTTSIANNATSADINQQALPQQASNKDCLTSSSLKKSSSSSVATHPSFTQPPHATPPLAINIHQKIVMLCIKPYALANFVYEGEAKAVYSVLAGVRIASLQQHMYAQSYIRLMPNIAALCLLSATVAFCVGADRAQVEAICRCFGSVVFVEEERLIDSSIATSGSSPAFLALIAQALVDAGVRAGLCRSDALQLVQQTFAGMGALLTQYTPQALIDSVTTPSGTTIEGLAVLESSGVRGAIMQACHASVMKATTNAKEYLNNTHSNS